jgi:hypothetical protein
MKTIKIALLLVMVFGVAVLTATCSSIPKFVPKDAPKEVKKAVSKAPKRALIGIGKATGGQLSETVAEARARTAISRQLNTIVRDMIAAYRAESSLDPSAALAFEENITVALSSATLTGSIIISKKQDAKGTWWAVAMLEKNNAIRNIVRAQNELKPKLGTPGSALSGVPASINITNINTDAIFEKVILKGAVVSSD